MDRFRRKRHAHPDFFIDAGRYEVAFGKSDLPHASGFVKLLCDALDWV